MLKTIVRTGLGNHFSSLSPALGVREFLRNDKHGAKLKFSRSLFSAFDSTYVEVNFGEKTWQR